jgi:hypothetical protein
LFAGAKVGSSETNSDVVLESPTKNTRKRKSTIPAVDVLQWQQGAQERTSRHWPIGSSGSIGFQFYVISRNRLYLMKQ